MAVHIGTPDLVNEAGGRLYRLAQANRLRRYCDQVGVDPVVVVAGRQPLDTTPICDDEGIIVPEPEDLHAVLYWSLAHGAEMLVEVLHTHPKVLLDGTVIDNPHYVDPTQYHPAARTAAATRYPLVRVGADDDDRTDHGWASLTDAELRVISRVAQGRSNRRVAEDLSVSRHTVDAHLKHIYLKLDVHSRVELTVLALQHRLPIG